MQRRTFWTTVMLIVFLVIAGCTPGAGGSGEGRDIILVVEAPELNLREVREVSTGADTLGDLLDELDIAVYEESSMGRFLVEVDGVEADPSGQYWSILVDGEYGMYGVDEQKLSDGEEFTLVLTDF